MAKSTFFDQLEGIPQDGRPLHLALGMFDGVHRGHQAVIGSAIQSARQCEGRSGVLTFWPHPSHLFRPDNPVPMISSPRIKSWLLEELGVEWIIQKEFNQAFAEVSAERFPKMLQEALPDLAGLYVGENFRFGKGRQGTVEDLAGIQDRFGMQLFSADRIKFNGGPISSTRIRECLENGKIGEANQMLGYNYFSLGQVEPGNQKGREIGVPTLNLPWDPECRPALGVYAVQVRVWDIEHPDSSGQRVPGVANFGVRPTVGDRTVPLLEVHLLQDKTVWKTGDSLRVDWLHFIRPEKQFPSFEALKTQIESDEAEARQFFRLHGKASSS